MSIVTDYAAVAKRLRELKAPAPKDAAEITELTNWRAAAMGARP